MALNPTDFEFLLRSLGFCDTDQLGLVNQEAIRQMKLARRAKGHEIAKTLQMGDTVRLPSNVKPKYLANQTGTVIDMKERRATVDLTNGPMGKFRNGHILCPFEMLTVIS